MSFRHHVGDMLIVIITDETIQNSSTTCRHTSVGGRMGGVIMIRLSIPLVMPKQCSCTWDDPLNGRCIGCPLLGIICQIRSMIRYVDPKDTWHGALRGHCSGRERRGRLQSARTGLTKVSTAVAIKTAVDSSLRNATITWIVSCFGQ